MASLVQRVAERYARQIEAAQEETHHRAQVPPLPDRRATEESTQSVQAPVDPPSAGRSGSAAPGDSQSLDSHIRWRVRLWKVAKRLLVQEAMRHAYNEKDDPDPADVEVDGESMDTDWDESATDWMQTKEAAVRKVLACLINDAANLPEIGRHVERIVRRVGTVDIYFDDGSFVSATVEDPQPRTNEEAEVIESVYGAPQSGCGCKHANCKHAQQEIEMVAAVYFRELLGARDARKTGAKTPRFWSYLVEGPFELYMLRDVPINLARDLNDFPSRRTRLHNPRQAWQIAQKYADSRPFGRGRGAM